jgi:hypothetical protein
MHQSGLALALLLTLSLPTVAQDRAKARPPDRADDQLVPAPLPRMPKSERRRIKRLIARLKRVMKKYPDTLAAIAAARIVRDYEDLLARYAPPAKTKKSRRRSREETPP